MSLLQVFEGLRIPLEAIKTATGDFAQKNYVGRGGFGKVYQGELVHFEEPVMVAVKRLDRMLGQGDTEFWKEIRMLSCYKHENLVSLIGFSYENEERVLVYEFVSRGSLDRHLSSTNLSWIQRLKICIGAGRGIQYLHDPGTTQQRVLHCDIKSANILLDDNWNAKVADFGLSKLGPANQQHTYIVSLVGGTFGYRDPCLSSENPFRKESDVYSFGVVLFEVLCGRNCTVRSYDDDDERRLLPQLAQNRYKEGKINEIICDCIRAEIEPDSLQRFSAIAYRCLQRNQKSRPSMAEIVEELETALVAQEKLTELPMLKEAFKLSRKEGRLIGRLGRLNKLEGKLEIKQLEEVVNLEEAKSAKLFEKSNIKALVLIWGKRQDGVPCSDDADVLEGLRPHSNLTSLEISRFKGFELPSWMMSKSVSALNNLVNVRLSDCDRCEQVPTLGQLPNLKKVELDGLRNVTRIGAEFYGSGEVSVFFPVLTELKLWHMTNLEEWVDVKDEFRSSLFTKKQPFPSLFTKKQPFPNLQKFEIVDCPKLINLPINNFNDFMDIRELYIGRCQSIKVIPDIKGLQTLTYLSLTYFGKSITELPKGIETLTSLITLDISGLPGVVSVPDLGGLKRLEELTIGGFSEELDEFPWPYDYPSLSSSSSSTSSSVWSLTLYGWAKLQHLPQQLEHFSASLTELKLFCFDGLESLPEWLGNLSSLHSLIIFDCSNLKSMPSQEAMCRLTKLRFLDISYSPVLEERCVKGSGSEWHKIQHIPCIEIDRKTIQDNNRV